MKLEKVPCDLCGSVDFDKLVDGKDWEFGVPGDFCVVSCTGCGLGQLNPRPAADSFDLVYPEEYGFYQTPSMNRFKRLAKEVIVDLTSRLHISTPIRLYPYFAEIGLEAGSILDVGCATGGSVYPFGPSGSLQDLRTKGWSVYGCEISREAADQGRSLGIEIQYGTIGDVDFNDGEFDVVRFNHVLEHSLSPGKDLRSACALLKKGGFVVVSVPNIVSAAFRSFGHFWSGLDLPRHFYHFSPTSLQKYFDESGFETFAVRYDGTADDYIHSLKHTINEIDGASCTKSNSLAKILPNGTIDLRKSLTPIVDFYNDRCLGDSVTIIGRAGR